MTNKIVSGPPSTIPEGPDKLQQKKQIEGFTITGQSASKNLNVDGKKLLVTLRLPGHLKTDEALKDFLKIYGNEKIQHFGKIAVAAGLGKDAVAVSFKQNEGEKFTNIEKHLKNKTTETIDRKYFQTKKTAISKNNRLDETKKAEELKKLEVLEKAIGSIQDIWKLHPKKIEDQVPQQKKEALKEEMELKFSERKNFVQAKPTNPQNPRLNIAKERLTKKSEIEPKKLKENEPASDTKDENYDSSDSDTEIKKSQEKWENL